MTMATISVLVIFFVVFDNWDEVTRGSQGLFGIPREGDCDYSEILHLDLGTVSPSVSGPRRPQDRIDLPELKQMFRNLFMAPASESGYGKDPAELSRRFPVKLGRAMPGGGSVRPPAFEKARREEIND